MSSLVEAIEVLAKPKGSSVLASTGQAESLGSDTQGLQRLADRLRIKPGELEAEGIMHRWHANPASVPVSIRDRAFEVVHG